MTAARACWLCALACPSRIASAPGSTSIESPSSWVRKPARSACVAAAASRSAPANAASRRKWLSFAACAPDRMPSTTRGRNAGVMIEVGLAAARPQHAVARRRGRAFQRAHHRRPDSDDAAAARARLGHGAHGRRRDVVALGQRQRGVDRRIARRAQPGGVGQRRPAHALAPQRQQRLPRQRPPRRRHLERPRARGVHGLHRPQRQLVREVGVLHRPPLAIQRVPQLVARRGEAQLHQPRRARVARRDLGVQRAEAQARADRQLGRRRPIFGARVPVAGAEQHGGERRAAAARRDQPRLDARARRRHVRAATRAASPRR